MNYKEFLGLAATAIAFGSYVPYFRDIASRKTKPHAFSWLVWSVLTGIAFFGQIADSAGPGAWVTGFTAIVCFTIFVFAIKQGEKNIVLIDWLSLAGAAVALLFWFFTKGPLLSVVIITLIDALGFFPTFRKSFSRPNEETLITFFLGGFKFILALLALEKVSVVTALYPASLVVMNWIFVGMLLLRRKQLHTGVR